MIDCKTESGQEYHDELKNQFSFWIDPRLRAVLTEADGWSRRTTRKGLLITCLNRTEEENQAVGGRKRSAHCYSRAADIRSWLFSTIEIKRLILHLQEVWGKEFLHVIHHDSGRGDHIHININRPFHRKNYAEAA